MRKYPRHRPDRWHQDEVDDYNRARSDDERRRILLRFGYDDAHQSEVWRLFPVRSFLRGNPRKIPDKKKIANRLLYIGSIAVALVAIRDLLLPVLKVLYKILFQ